MTMQYNRITRKLNTKELHWVLDAVLGLSFSWDVTSEGFVFWSRISGYFNGNKYPPPEWDIELPHGIKFGEASYQEALTEATILMARNKESLTETDHLIREYITLKLLSP